MEEKVGQMKLSWTDEEIKGKERKEVHFVGG